MGSNTVDSNSQVLQYSLWKLLHSAVAEFPSEEETNLGSVHRHTFPCFGSYQQNCHQERTVVCAPLYWEVTCKSVSL